MRCEIQGDLECLLTVLLKQYVSCKLSFDEIFVIFVDFVLGYWLCSGTQTKCSTHVQVHHTSSLCFLTVLLAIDFSLAFTVHWLK